MLQRPKRNIDLKIKFLSTGPSILLNSVVRVQPLLKGVLGPPAAASSEASFYIIVSCTFP